MNETEYHGLCDELFAAIERMLDDADADYDSNGGMIEAELPDGGKMIINRQPAAREVWVAAPSGGWHFRFQDSQWKNTRDDSELMETLAGLVGG